MSARQTHFRVNVDPVFAGIDTPQRHPSETAGFRLAAQLRRELERCINSVMTCQPASMAVQLDRLGSVRTVAESCLPFVPEPQRLRSPRQLIHPLTLCDWIEAARITGQAHRSPDWAPLACDRLDQIDAKVDSLAALVCRIGSILNDGGAR